MLEILYRLGIPLVLGVLALLTGATMLVDRGGDPRTPGEGWWSGALLEVTAPLQKGISMPMGWVRDRYERYVDLLDLRTENERLQARVVALEEENLQYREALVAGGRLQRIVGMRDHFEAPLQPAEVVGQDVSPWFRSLLIDRGRRHGVRSGMPMVTDRGVVGLVTATSPHASRAMLVLDRQSAVDGIVQRSRARGIVRGTGSERLEFVFVVRGDDVRVGDVVITSGVGGVYPKGLRIGEVTEVEVDEDRLLHTAVVEPAVDLGRLEQVFVLLQRGPIMELLHPEDEGILPTAVARGGSE
ncbi:MAG: rod shape-determining protein MreC [Myxococcota bacterium]